jgi:hypothetical protein
MPVIMKLMIQAISVGPSSSSASRSDWSERSDGTPISSTRIVMMIAITPSVKALTRSGSAWCSRAASLRSLTCGVPSHRPGARQSGSCSRSRPTSDDSSSPNCEHVDEHVDMAKERTPSEQPEDVRTKATRPLDPSEAIARIPASDLERTEPDGLPRIDGVVVAGDPADPLVFGGLWSAADPPPAGVGDEGTHAIVTRSGVRIGFDGDDGAVTAETVTATNIQGANYTPGAGNIA